MIALFFSLFLAFVASTTASKKKNCPKYTFIPFSGSAKDAKGLEPVVNKFRAALGAPNNMNSIGPFAKGHREVRCG